MSPRVYYNEWDSFAAAWLRELIKAGELPDGEVDERSITDVQPDDLREFTQCHFFAGIGGWAYALRLAAWGDRPVWTGSCPCQGYSQIGQNKGATDARNLWPAWFRLIHERRPQHVFGEQVANAVGHGWLDAVSTDLEAEDYAVGTVVLGAHSVGAPHIRPRLYWVGHAQHAGLAGHGGNGDDGRHAEADRPDTETGGASSEPAGLDAVSMLRGLDLRDPRRARRGLRVSADRGVADRSVWAEHEALACADGWRQVQPGTFPMVDGIPARVGRLRGYGNAIVPQVAAEVIGAYLDLERVARDETPPVIRQWWDFDTTGRACRDVSEEGMTLLEIAERKLTKVEQLEAFFKARPNVWIDGLDLEFAGKYAWRSRVSDLRRPPFTMTIENRERWKYGAHGEKLWKVSEYRYVP